MTAGTLTIDYSCLQEPLDGDGNFVAVPRFADNVYCHLLSHGGYYAGGFFEGGYWARTRTDSPCIDAGDPLSDYTLEPPRRGDRVNLGACGNTPVASRTYRPEETLLMVR